MTIFTLIGLLSCAGGGLLIGFQALSSVMGARGGWKNLSLMDAVGGQYFEWMGNPTFGGAERAVEYIVTMPLFVLLFCIGGLFFILDYFLGRR